MNRYAAALLIVLFLAGLSACESTEPAPVPAKEE